MPAKGHGIYAAVTSISRYRMPRVVSNLRMPVAAKPPIFVMVERAHH